MIVILTVDSIPAGDIAVGVAVQAGAAAPFAVGHIHTPAVVDKFGQGGPAVVDKFGRVG
jgi:hypothetical protein